MDHQVDVDASTVCSEADFGLDDLPLDFAGCEQMMCPICGSKPSDDSPLVQIGAAARCGKNMPCKCNKVSDHVDGVRTAVARKPAGRFDRICTNVFYALGLGEKFSGLKVFYAHVCKPENAAQARHFISCRIMWIESHNSDDDHSARLLSNAQLKQKWTTLTSEHSESFTLEDDGLEFQDIAFWDESTDGKLDKAKVVERVFQGKTISGVWIRTGREGRYKFSRKDSVSCRRVFKMMAKAPSQPSG